VFRPPSHGSLTSWGRDPPAVPSGASTGPAGGVNGTAFAARAEHASQVAVVPSTVIEPAGGTRSTVCPQLSWAEAESTSWETRIVVDNRGNPLFQVGNGEYLYPRAIDSLIAAAPPVKSTVMPTS
jgi:hypothetical protein